MTIYTERLEQIIRDMQTALPAGQSLPWLHFLREIHPESELLQIGNDGAPQAREPTETTRPKECRDVRELMMLAERNGYPTWSIHPYVEDGAGEKCEAILFPTNKVQSISSAKLEELFRKYLDSIKEQGIAADRVLIKSSTQITDMEGETHSFLVYAPNATD